MAKKKNKAVEASAEVISYVETVTPDLAIKWLKTSAGNRPISKERLTAYADDMTAGRWHVTDQGIGFDAEGRLVNGHHRLRAVIRSGVSIQSLVVMGLVSEATHKIDTGGPRTPGHILGMVYGITSAPNSVAALARVFCSVADGINLHPKADPKRWAEIYENNPQSFKFGCASYGKAGYPSSCVGVLTFAYSINPDAVQDFSNKIRSKVGIASGDAEAAFLLAFERHCKGGGAVAQQKSIALTTAAIWHKLKGIPVTILRSNELAREWLRKNRIKDL